MPLDENGDIWAPNEIDINPQTLLEKKRAKKKKLYRGPTLLSFIFIFAEKKEKE